MLAEAPQFQSNLLQPDELKILASQMPARFWTYNLAPLSLSLFKLYTHSNTPTYVYTLLTNKYSTP